jgi:hypothetical protein
MPLKANGAVFKIGDWQPYAVDGLLITGQKPAHLN